jgi:cyclin H
MAVDELSKRMKITHDKLLQNEVLLLQGIKFELLVYHPFRPLQGFLWDMADTLGYFPFSFFFFFFLLYLSLVYSMDTTEIKNQALSELNAIMPTDLPLLYSPSLLALAALSKVAKQTTNLPVSQYISSTISQHAHDAQQTVAEIVVAMEGKGRGALPAETIRGLDKKLKTCVTSMSEVDPDAKTKEAERLAEKQKAKALQHSMQEKADLEFMTKPS